jgi:predicted CXXCH cytochrome family protein
MFTAEQPPSHAAVGTAPGRRAAAVWPKAIIVVGALAALICLSIGVARKWWGAPRAATADNDPRRTYDTPFRNVRPGVKYVGDDACAECHKDLAAKYHKHPMGRSLAPVADAVPQERFDAENHNPFQARGASFLVTQRGQQVFHKQVYRDAQDREVAALEAEVHYVLGSGSQGRSYLIASGGYVVQSPISWYSRERIWDLSPGYKKNFFGFGRQVTVECLFCHSNRVEPVEHTENQYREPIFRGAAIGCERCHGPGQLHVESRQRGEEPDGVDFTIVNSRHLEPVLREAVCEQCHLQGEVRIVRRARGPFDYRPGLPFHLFVSNFVRSPDSISGYKSVGHVEQMHLSKCYQQSGGKFGCISCHDPHELPEAQIRVAYYRDRCLNCHETKPCSLDLTVRREKNKADSCIDCHMPRGSSENIVHAAATDHRVVRRQDEPPRPPHERAPGGIPLLYFHRDLVDPQDPDVERDLAVAMVEMARFSNFDRLSRQVCRTSVDPLTFAVGDAPDDVDAWEARGYALWGADRRDEALAASETALALAPRREVALRDAAFFAANLGRDDLAVTYWRRLLDVNPWQETTHFNLARVAAKHEDWPDVLRECQAGLRLDPTSTESRTLLVLYYAKTGEPARARAEFDALLALKPPKEEELRRWFADLKAP